MTITFMRYPSITNHNQIPPMNHDFRNAMKSNELWYSTEKIHGGNISFIITESNLGVASRNGLIYDDSKAQGEEFTPSRLISDNQFKSMMDNPRLIEMIAQVREYIRDNQLTQAIVYGEYFGDNVFKMQYTMEEGKENEVRFFNVFTTTDLINYVILSRSEACKLVGEGMMTQVLKVGTLAELLSIEPDEKSTLGAIISEGVVLQKLDGQLYDSGRGGFMAIKYKTEQFQETKLAPPRTPLKNMEHGSKMIEYVTQARLDNLVSGTGEKIARENMRSLVMGMREDIVREYTRAHSIEHLYDEVHEESRALSKYIAMLIVE